MWSYLKRSYRAIIKFMNIWPKFMGFYAINMCQRAISRGSSRFVVERTEYLMRLILAIFSIDVARLFLFLLTNIFIDPSPSTCDGIFHLPYSLRVVLDRFVFTSSHAALNDHSSNKKSRNAKYRIFYMVSGIPPGSYPKQRLTRTYSFPRKYRKKAEKNIKNLELPCCTTSFWWCD